MGREDDRDSQAGSLPRLPTPNALGPKVTDKDQQCDVCHSESPNGRYVGVAAVPAAPVSVAWCNNCLANNAVPRFVAETWLFSEFWLEQEGSDKRINVMPKKPPKKFPLAEWAGHFTIWLGPGPGYVPLEDCYKDLWEHEYARNTGS